MRILILNGSPQGPDSITLQTALYIQKLHPEHEFMVLNTGQRIRQYEQDFAPIREALAAAELIVFCYPVYTFIAPYQVHRLIELIKEDGIDLSGKIATQITTSKHFYDVTAHGYINENCFDLGMKVVRGLSADMDDLLVEKGQKEARMFFEQLMYSIEHEDFLKPAPKPQEKGKNVYPVQIAEADPEAASAAEPAADAYAAAKAADADAAAEAPAIASDYDVVIVTNYAPDDENLQNMISDFRAALPCSSRVVNIREFPFAGGCLGCMGCAIDGKCVYKDGFDEFLRSEIQQADGLVYAFTIENHYAHSSFKCYDDRQFCNGHRTVTSGTPAAYILSGDYSYETNLQVIVEGRCEVGGNYLCGVATDEHDDPRETASEIRRLAESLQFALENGLERPANFYGVGGSKIFRDLIYVMQGFMKADHKYFKANGKYNFPQKQKRTIFMMWMVGFLMSRPALRKRMKKPMSDYMVAPYKKVLDSMENPS